MMHSRCSLGTGSSNRCSRGWGLSPLTLPTGTVPPVPAEWPRWASLRPYLSSCSKSVGTTTLMAALNEVLCPVH